MKYYIIVGEASGDLHASRLMECLCKEDPDAQFRFFGGDKMSAVGGTRVRHYKELAYMGFVPVLLHLPTIIRNMRLCKQDIVKWQPDVVILVDYPGFNLSIAKFVTKANRLIGRQPDRWDWLRGISGTTRQLVTALRHGKNGAYGALSVMSRPCSLSYLSRLTSTSKNTTTPSTTLVTLQRRR